MLASLESKTWRHITRKANDKAMTLYSIKYNYKKTYNEVIHEAKYISY